MRLVTITAVILAATGSLLLINVGIFEGLSSPVSLVLLFWTLGCVIALLLSFVRGRETLASWVLLLTVTVAVAIGAAITGGLTGPATPWMLIPGGLAVLLFGVRIGWMFSAAIMIDAVVLSFLEVRGQVVPDLLESANLFYLRGLSLVMSVAVVATLLTAFDRARRHVLRARAESERMFRQLAENIAEVFWMTDPVKSRMLYVSKAYNDVWGRTPESLYADPMSFVEAIHGDDRDRVLAAFPGQTQGTYDEEYRVVRPDGSVRWVRDRAFPVRDERGRVYRVTGVATDITEMKRAAEAQLAQSAERLEVTVKNVPGIVYRALPDWTAEFAGDVEGVSGYTVGEINSLDGAWQAVVHPDDLEDVTREGAKLLEQAGSITQVYRILTKGGEVRWVEDRKTSLFSATGSLQEIHGIIIDVTDRHVLEQQLRQSQKMEAVGRLAGGVAHDFNNVLTAIFSFTRFTLDGLGEEDQAHEDLQEVIKAADRAKNLTRQLLAFSRKQTIVPRVLSLNPLVRDAEKMLRRLLGADVEFSVELAEDLWHTKIDPGAFEQVMMNLAVNARDAMPQGGEITLATANISRRDVSTIPEGEVIRPDDYVMFAVRDTGEGMDETTRRRIFEPFFTTKVVGKGTGLGLSMCYGIVKQANGYIMVQSELGRGTEFNLYFPRDRAHADEVQPQSEPTQLVGSEVILVVEDDEQVRTLVLRSLKKYGYLVLEAGNAGEALLIAEKTERQIHLLVTDVIMPHLSGVELAKRVEAMCPGIKVLFMSGYTDETIARHGVGAEGVEMLEKPFDPEDLGRRVRGLLDQSAREGSGTGKGRDAIGQVES